MPAPLITTAVRAVHRDAEHRFSKQSVPAITLEPGLGVVGDAHWGHQVRHRSRVKADPSQPNLRQVHLIAESLFDHLRDLDFSIAPGDLGENITLADADGLGWRELIALPLGTQLAFSAGPVLRLTGLRNPCVQIDAHQRGLLAAMVGREPTGRPLLKTGVMSVVLTGGTVKPGDAVTVHLPPLPHERMERV